MLLEFGNSYCIIVLLLVEWQKHCMGLHLSPTWVGVVAESECEHEQSHFYKTLLQNTFTIHISVLNYIDWASFKLSFFSLGAEWQ